MTKKIITRAEAKVQGLQRYFTGKACKHGHVVERRTSGGNCMVCWAEWCAKHPARMNAYRSKWDEANAEKSAACKRQWRVENPDKQRAAAEAWAEANPIRRAARIREWARSNPEYVAAKTSRRRAREFRAEGAHTASDLKAILARQNNCCVYCDADFAAVGKHLDHILPLILGGSNDPENLQYLCPPCNLAKGAKHPHDFAIERGITLARRSQSDG
jgi:5-methylcytosine-specific restriction endonuclease McrA